MSSLPYDQIKNTVPVSNTDVAPFISAGAPSGPTDKIKEGEKAVPPQQKDLSSGRISPEALSFDQAYRYLGGEPLSSVEQGIGRTNKMAQQNEATFQQGVQGGAPQTPFGQQQTQTIEAGLQAGATEQQGQAVTDILSTEYTGPTQLPGTTPTPGGAGVMGRAVTKGFGTGQQFQGMLGQGTSGETREEAARVIGSEQGRQKVGQVQRSADASYRMLSDVQGREQPAVAQGQQKAADFAAGGRGYLQNVQQNITDRTQAEVDRINAAKEVADTAYQKFTETGNIEDLRAAGEDYVDPSVFALSETPTAKMSEEAKGVWNSVWEGEDFRSIHNVPLMRRTVSGQGYERRATNEDFDSPGNQSLRLDPSWIASRNDLFGILRQPNPDGSMSVLDRYLMGHQWMPGGSQSKTSRTGDRRVPMPGWDELSDEVAAAIHKLNMYHTRALERQGELANAGFGKGGKYEVFRPINGFGFVRQWKPQRYAGYVSQLITKGATLRNTMTVSDQKRYNVSANFLGAVAAAYEEGEPDNIPDKLTGDLERLMEDETFNLERRADTLDRNQQEWLRILHKTRRAYRSHRHDVNMDAAISIALIVIAATVAGPLITEFLAAAGAGAVSGTSALAPLFETGATVLSASESAAAALAYSSIQDRLSEEGIDLSIEEIQALVQSAYSVGGELADNLEGTVELGGEHQFYGRQYREGDAVIYDREQQSGPRETAGR